MIDRELNSTYTLFVGGEWRPAVGGATFDVRDPASGQVVGVAADGYVEDVDAAIAAASAAQESWGDLPAEDRSRFLREIANRLRQPEVFEPIAAILTAENGKPRREARNEVVGAADFFDWNAEEARRTYGRMIPSRERDKRIFTVKRPIGVVAAITAWNFPVHLVARKLSAALAAGCTAIVKPSEEAPLSVAALFRVFQQVALPAGVANLITTNRPADVGARMLESTAVRLLTFTGSTETGRLLMASAAKTMKRLILELGGHAPVLVFEDADFSQAVPLIAEAKFRAAGQICVAANRVYVARSRIQEFADMIAKVVQPLRLGPGGDDESQVGPLINASAMAKVGAHVQDVVERGGTVVLGGSRATEPRLATGNFYQPTLLVDVPASSRILREETFGPVLPLVPFDSEDEAIRLANSTSYGLAAYVFTKDVSRVFRLVHKLEFGNLGINDMRPFGPHIPTGGLKQSGIGKENGIEGIEEYLETRAVSVKL